MSGKNGKATQRDVNMLKEREGEKQQEERKERGKKRGRESDGDRI